MTTHPIDPLDDKRRTDEAWSKLQQKLAAEPASAKWAAWPSADGGSSPFSWPDAGEMPNVPPSSYGENGADAFAAPHDGPAGAASQQALTIPAESTVSVNRSRPLRGRRKWAGVAAAGCVLLAVLATPLGNKALASILNQFHMQDVTVVNESDVRSLFYQMTDGHTSESMNKFGTFTNTGGKVQGDFAPEQASKQLHYKLIPGELVGNPESVQVTPSAMLTLKLNVKEVNLAMKRLGATKLLPQSVDGKPVTLTIPETVHYSMNDGKQWADLSQLAVPFVTVDPSIKVGEALDAVLNFPLLPDDLKENLKQSRILSGAMPMPVIAGEEAEKMTIEGTPVILQQRNNGHAVVYNASWVKDGELYRFDGGDLYAAKDTFMNKLKALIRT